MECKTIGKREAEAQSGRKESPRCRFPGGVCKSPVPDLSEEDQEAMLLLTQVAALRCWEYTSSPMTGERMAVRLSISDVESVARGIGLEWSEHLLDKLAVGANELLQQDAKARSMNAKRPLIW
jgi:hypothetical protein